MTCLFQQFIVLEPLISTTPVGPGIGYQNQDGELLTHRQTWTVSGQTLPLTLPVPNGSVTRLGAIVGAEIIATGSLVTTGALWIDGPTTNINTAIATQKGGGIVTLVDPQTVGINGVNNINVQAGATLRLGTDWTKQHGWYYGAGNGQMANLGTVEVRSSSYFSTDPQIGGNASADAITRIIGNPSTGSAYWRRASFFSNSGLVEIQDAAYVPSTFIGTGGTVRVKQNAQYVHKTSGTSQGQIFKISGNGVSPTQTNFRGTAALQYPRAALAFEYGSNFLFTRIDLEASATIAYAGIFDLTAYGATPPITSAVTSVLTIGCPPINAADIYEGYGDNSYTTLSSINTSLLGPVRVEYGTLGLRNGQSMPNAQYLELVGNGKLNLEISNFVRSIRSTSATTNVNVPSGMSLILNAQEATPVASNFTGAGTVTLNTGGTLIFDRDTVSMTGLFNITSPTKVGTVRAQTQLSGPLTLGNTSALVVNNVGGAASRLNATTVTLNTGWKVDLAAGIAPGTYTIMTRTAGSAIPPTLGVNDTGLTATIAWSGANLILTLS